MHKELVRKAETQVFDLPNEGQSLSTDIARPCNLLDDEESLVSADAQRSLYLIVHTPNYVKAYRWDEELDKVTDDEVEGGGNGAGEEGGMPRPRAVGSPAGGSPAVPASCWPREFLP